MLCLQKKDVLLLYGDYILVGRGMHHLKQQDTGQINKLLPRIVDYLLACLECGLACGMERKESM